MPEKTFDKADLLKFFDESGHAATVGKLTVVFPAKDLFGETTTERYLVEAVTTAMWCERYGFAVAVQRVVCDGLHHLPRIHYLRTERPLHFRYGNGGSSAALVRWAMELADEWRLSVAASIPRILDLTLGSMAPLEPGQTSYTLVGSDSTGLGQLDPEPKPDEPLTDDNRPTGTTIDDITDEGDE